MTIAETMPIACTLSSGEAKHRASSIAALNSEALIDHQRRDLVLTLRYAPAARARIRDMVRKEQTCCAFLGFDLQETAHVVRLTITAPEAARDTADALFAPFLAKARAAAASCGGADAAKPAANEPAGAKAAGATAMTLSTGALACGACCVLPFTLPATVLASTGSLLSAVIHMRLWLAALSIVAVIGGWGWIAWQVRRTGRKPSVSTLAMMTVSTLIMMISLLWPLVEKPLISALRA